MLLRKDDSILLLIDVQEKLTPLVQQAQALINACVWMLKLAHRLQVPVLVSEQYSKGLGATLPSLLACLPDHNPVEKVYFSCMQDPNYPTRLKAFHKKQVVLIGIETHVCVLQTALDLIDHGYEVFVVVDAVSSRHELDYKYALKRMKQCGAHLVTAEMVFFEWVGCAGTSEFKALSKDFLQGESK